MRAQPDYIQRLGKQPYREAMSRMPKPKNAEKYVNGDDHEHDSKDIELE
jgi:hypothetical protein